jgi:phospholipase C
VPFVTVLVLALATLIGFAPATQASGGPCGGSTTRPARVAHVLWIFLENHSFSQVVGAPGSSAAASAPYLNRTLLPECGVLTRYSAITHPSLPNYLAATSGSTGGVRSDCAPTTCPQSRPSLFSELANEGRSWRSYEESMPAACDTASRGLYAARHNPALYYRGLTGLCRRDIAFGTTAGGALARDLASGRLPAFGFVTPNLCHDMHNCSVSQGDAWLRTWVPRITNSPAYRQHALVLFITWDEGTEANNHVATVVVSPWTPRGARIGGAYNHYSLLKTTEQLLGLPYLGHAAYVSSFRYAAHL